jgi:hypothetical protein
MVSTKFDLSQQIDAFSKKAAIVNAEILKRISLEAYKIVLQLSPVKFGRYRASNRLSVNIMDRSFAPVRKSHSGPKQGDAPASSELGDALRNLTGLSSTDSVFISNTVPYAKLIEDGRGHFAPGGVYRPMETLLQSRVRSIIADVRVI